MNISQLFYWYVKIIWPFQRKFVRKINRCQKCILSEKYIEIINGLCKICKVYKPNSIKDLPHQINELSQVFNNCHSDNNYDATVLLSGGKDSAYVLHRLQQDYPQLKLLCITINDGFMSSVVNTNTKYITEKLNVDHLFINSYIPTFKEVLRKAFISLQGRSCYGIIDFTDGSWIFKIGCKITKSFNIPMMITGLSWAQLEHISNDTNFISQENNEQIKIIYPLVVWRTDEQEIYKYIHKYKLLPKGNTNPLISNYQLVPLMAYLDIKNLGYSSFEPEFAQLIREGKTNRKEWLLIFEAITYLVKSGYLNSEAKRILNKLDLTLKDII
jgi:3'-phosphoadenosine 5'-phosphosulfate sulfotransferase (PAPS reductase)/FAD synthetase